MIEIGQRPSPEHYPDIVAAGGLQAALERLVPRPRPNVVLTSVREMFVLVRCDPYELQLMPAQGERAFRVDVWKSKRRFMKGWTGSLSNVAELVAAMGDGVSPDLWERSWLKQVDVDTDLSPAAFVEMVWNNIERDLREDPIGVRLHPLFQACRARREIAQLYPYTFVDRLTFSRVTQWPFTTDCPSGYWIAENYFRVLRPGAAGAKEPEGILGEGSAETAAGLIAAHLPPNVGPAVHGTAKDL